MRDMDITDWIAVILVGTIAIIAITALLTAVFLYTYYMHKLEVIDQPMMQGLYIFLDDLLNLFRSILVK